MLSDDPGSSDHLVLPCVMNNSIVASSMPDSGAKSQFMDYDWAHTNGIQIKKKRYLEKVEVVDGTEITSGLITHEGFVQLRNDNHVEKLKFQLTKLGHYPIILGQAWLKKHNPDIKWCEGNIKFTHPFCSRNCISKEKFPSTLAPSVTFPIRAISLICASAFQRHTKNKRHSVFALSLYEIKEQVKKSEEDIVPREYHEFIELFKKPAPDSASLPPYRSYDHQINLKPNTQPSFGPIYGLSEVELKALKTYIDENLSRSFIRASSHQLPRLFYLLRKKTVLYAFVSTTVD